MIHTEKVIEEVQADGTTKYYIRTRKFLGRTEDFESKDQEAFEKAHLRAYLKGAQQFKFRYTGDDSFRQPAIFQVLEALFKSEISKEQADTYIKKHKRVSEVQQ